MTDAAPVQMPQRWDFAGDYDDYLVPLEEGDYVKVEDVSPLVAEINRLRDKLAKARRITDELLNGDQDYRDGSADLWILQSVLKD